MLHDVRAQVYVQADEGLGGGVDAEFDGGLLQGYRQLTGAIGAAVRRSVKVVCDGW